MVSTSTPLGAPSGSSSTNAWALVEDAREARLVERVGADLGVLRVLRAREERLVHAAVQEITAREIVLRVLKVAVGLVDELIEAALVARITVGVAHGGGGVNGEREEGVGIARTGLLDTGERDDLRVGERPPHVELVVAVAGTKLLRVFVTVGLRRWTPLAHATTGDQQAERESPETHPAIVN